MVRGQKREILSETELNTLREERQEIRQTLENLDAEKGEKFGEGTPAVQIDRAALARQEKKLKDAIEYGSPKELHGIQKDRVAKEASELEDKIKEGMPSRDEMDRPLRHPGAVQKHLNWERKNIHNVLRWKQLKRQLNPGDPTCSSVENLRRD